MFKKIGLYVAGVVFFLLSFPSLAHAYLDPGMGSYMLQMIIGGVVSVGVVFRRGIKHLSLSVLTLFKSKNKDNQQRG